MTAFAIAEIRGHRKPGGGEIRVLEHPQQGYEDSKSDWPWIMLPQNECRTLLLDLDKAAPVRLGNVDEEGFAGNRLNSYFQVKRRGNELTLCGLPAPIDAGNKPVDVFQPGRHLRIWVSVKKRRNVPIAVHYVDHGPILEDGRPLTTRVTRDHMREMIKVANSILTPQANISMSIAVEGKLGPDRLGKRLGFSVSRREAYRNLFPHKIDVPKQPAELPPMNLFLVRLANTGPEPEIARYFSEFQSCVLEDHLLHGEVATNGGGKTLAHETGHHLGLLHHDNIEYLMYGRGMRTGDKLYRYEIDRMSSASAVK